MIFIWTGLGFIVPLIGIVVLFALTTIFMTVLPGDLAAGWVFAATCFVSAVACWFFGGLMQKSGARTYIDKKTGQEVLQKKSNTFFFIPVKWWAIPYGLFMCLFLLVAVTTNNSPPFELDNQPIPEYEISGTDEVSMVGLKMFTYQVIAPESYTKENLELIAKDIINSAKPHHVVTIWYHSDAQNITADRPFAKTWWGSEKDEFMARGNYETHVLKTEILPKEQRN